MWPGGQTPDEWYESIFKVIFKSGDRKLAKNYRPICIIPMLYKLFSTLLSRRLRSVLDNALTQEQAGFRNHFNTVDHVHAFAQVQEKSAEWQVEMWTCFLDFEKAFDSVEHEAIWKALVSQGVEPAYIHILKKLYGAQKGRVAVTGKLSRLFDLGRGTKQGDPLSTLLFNAVLEDVFRSVRAKWADRKYGVEMSLGAECRLTNVCFADDVALFATSLKNMKAMMADLVTSAGEKGLVAHAGKTIILTNADVVAKRELPAVVEVEGQHYQVTGSMGVTKWLGRKIRFHDPNDFELSNRIASAWGAFTKFKWELTNRQFRLKDRLKLFNAVVTSTMLYGCEAWTLKTDQQRRVRAVQRRMLRLVLNSRRRRVQLSDTSQESDDGGIGEEEGHDEQLHLLEPWHEFLRRTACSTEEQLKAAGQKEWLTIWRTRQWNWARKLVNEDSHKWSATATKW